VLGVGEYCQLEPRFWFSNSNFNRGARKIEKTEALHQKVLNYVIAEFAVSGNNNNDH